MNPRLLASLLDTHAAALGLFARSWCASPEDAVQEAFARLIRQSPPPGDPVAWLYRVVRHAAMDAGKAERRRLAREAAVARPEQALVSDALDAEECARALAALEALPPEVRGVIVARLWGGQTLEAIARAVGCSVSTAFRRYEAGLASLRAALNVPCDRSTLPLNGGN